MSKINKILNPSKNNEHDNKIINENNNTNYNTKEIEEDKKYCDSSNNLILKNKIGSKGLQDINKFLKNLNFELEPT